MYRPTDLNYSLTFHPTTGNKLLPRPNPLTTRIDDLVSLHLMIAYRSSASTCAFVSISSVAPRTRSTFGTHTRCWDILALNSFKTLDCCTSILVLFTEPATVGCESGQWYLYSHMNKSKTFHVHNPMVVPSEQLQRSIQTWGLAFTIWLL